MKAVNMFPKQCFPRNLNLILSKRNPLRFPPKLRQSIECNRQVACFSCQPCLRLPSKCYSTQPAEARERDPNERVSPKSEIKLEPLKSIGLLGKIKKIKKDGSFISNLFMGRFDQDFLNYPQVLGEESEYETLRKQRVMIETHFREVLSSRDAQSQLNQLGFNDLWSSSATEMSHTMEAIGSTMVPSYDHIEATLGGHVADTRSSGASLMHLPVERQNLKLILSLIIKNSLSFPCILASENKPLRDRILAEIEARPDMKIGFAFCEKHVSLGAVSFPEFDSEAALVDGQRTWAISGKKSHILSDDYDYYIVFCKTTDYLDDRDLPKNYEQPYGMVAFLLPKDSIDTIEETEEHGIKYQTITFPKLMIPREEIELIRPDLRAIKAFNAKGLGQLSVSALILGQLKASLRTMYSYLNNRKPASLKSELIQNKLCEITYRIYSLESALYLTAALYDSLDTDRKYEKHLEATLTKTMATDFAFKTYGDFQSLFSSDVIMSPALIDETRIMDSFLEGSIHNKILVGLHALRLVGAYKNDYIHKTRLVPFFPQYQVIDWWNSRRHQADKPKLDLDLKSYIGSRLIQEAEMLEYSVKRMEWAAERVVFRWVKEAPQHQVDVTRLGLLALEAFKMTAVLSRASKAISLRLNYNDVDHKVAKSIAHRSWLDMKDVVYALEHSPYLTNDERNRKVHERNELFGGYFAYSPLDKVHY